MQRLTLSIILVLTLSACGGAPGEDDIEAAIKKAVPSIPGMEVAVSVSNVECSSAGNDQYSCTFDMESEARSSMLPEPMVTRMTTTSIFIKRDSGWVAVQ